MKPIHSRRAVLPFGRASRLVLAATVGHATLDARLGALAPLRQALTQGSLALFDDGTLNGADRVRIARECSDPLILAGRARGGGFPTTPQWTLLLTALEQRRNAYWVMIGGALPERVIPDLARAIASNRCFAIADEKREPAALQPHLDVLARDGFPHIGVSARLLGFAASSDGQALATAVFARLERVLGERARRPGMARVLAGFILARERQAVLLPEKPAAVHSPGRISLI